MQPCNDTIIELHMDSFTYFIIPKSLYRWLHNKLYEDFKNIMKEPWTKRDNHEDFEKIAKEPRTIQDDPEDSWIIYEGFKEPRKI